MVSLLWKGCMIRKLISCSHNPKSREITLLAVSKECTFHLISWWIWWGGQHCCPDEWEQSLLHANKVDEPLTGLNWDQLKLVWTVCLSLSHPKIQKGVVFPSPNMSSMRGCLFNGFCLLWSVLWIIAEIFMSALSAKQNIINPLARWGFSVPSL